MECQRHDFDLLIGESLRGGVYSWDDFVGTINAQGHKLQVTRVPAEAYDNFYSGAHEIREMFQYYEQYTDFGPEHEKRVAAAHALVPGGFTGFADWAKIPHES